MLPTQPGDGFRDRVRGSKRVGPYPSQTHTLSLPTSPRRPPPPILLSPAKLSPLTLLDLAGGMSSPATTALAAAKAAEGDGGDGVSHAPAPAQVVRVEVGGSQAKQLEAVDHELALIRGQLDEVSEECERLQV